jgi:hypothetical protein
MSAATGRCLSIAETLRIGRQRACECHWLVPRNPVENR